MIRHDDHRPWEVLVLVAGLLASGCSRIEILYRQADWLIVRYVEDFVTLTGPQHERLKADVGELLASQCMHQFPVVSDALTRFEADVRQRRLNPQGVAGYSDVIENLWYSAVEQATPAAANLLANLNETQAAELFRSMEERNWKIEQEIRETTRRQVVEDYASNTRKQLERWFGSLEPDQEARVQAWAEAFQPLGGVGLTYRRNREAVLRTLVSRHRGDPAGMDAALRDLVEQMRRQQPEDYRFVIQGNRALTYDMLADVASRATPEQVDHLRESVASVREDLSNIDCE